MFQLAVRRAAAVQQGLRFLLVSTVAHKRWPIRISGPIKSRKSVRATRTCRSYL